MRLHLLYLAPSHHDTRDPVGRNAITLQFCDELQNITHMCINVVALLASGSEPTYSFTHCLIIFLGSSTCTCILPIPSATEVMQA